MSASVPIRIHLHLLHDLSQSVDGSDGGLGLGLQRLPEMLVEILADRVVPEALRIFPAQAQILERAVDFAASGSRTDHGFFSGSDGAGAASSFMAPGGGVKAA